MSHPVTVAGKTVHLEWTQRSAKALRLRASKIGLDLGGIWQDLRKNDKAEYSLACFLWLLLPAEVSRAYPTPEDVWLDVEDEDVSGVAKAIVGVISDMDPSAEKKSSSGKPRSRTSN